MSDKIKILAVDDEAVNRKMLQSILAKHQTTVVESGYDCLEQLQQSQPDIILLDVLMPELNGLEVCKKIRQNPQSSEIPIIFVSALVSPEDRMAGFDAGGDDYISKPFNSTELELRIRHAILQRQKIQNYQAQYEQASQVAMSAMKNASNMGQILQFYHESLQITEAEKLAEHLLQAVQQLELSSITKFNLDDGSLLVEKSSRGALLPIESAVFDELRKQDRIFSYKNRSMFNGDHIALLILDMPVQNEEEYGQLKDHIIMLLEATEARFKSMLLESEKQQQQTKLIRLIQNTHQTLDRYQESKNQLRKRQTDTVQQLSDRIEILFNRLGLDEEQENHLTDFVASTQFQLDQLFDEDMEASNKLKSIITEMEQIL